MKAYILTVVWTSVIASAVLLFTPEGSGGGIGKHIKLLTSLVLLCAVTDPLLSFIKSISNNGIDVLKDEIRQSAPQADPYQNIFYEELSKMTAEDLENELKALISETFSIDREDLEVRAEYVIDGNSLSFKRIVVILSGKAIFKDPYDIEAYVREISLIECICRI